MKERPVVYALLLVFYVCILTGCWENHRRDTATGGLKLPPIGAMPQVRGQDRLGPTPQDQERQRDAAGGVRLLPFTASKASSLPRPADGRLSVSIEEAVFLTLSNNRSLGVQLFSPVIAGTFEDQERAVFDPAVFAEVSASRSKYGEADHTTNQAVSVRGESESYRVGIGQALPTGTDVELSFSQSRDASAIAPMKREAAVALTLTQALLRGANMEANLARVRQAELDMLASLYEVRGFTESLVAEVETTYWNYVLAEERVKIYQEAYRVAQKQSLDIERRVEVGSIAETELSAAQAELASRRQGLIDANSLRERTRLSLLRFLNPEAADGWSLQLEARDMPRGPDITLDPVDDHVALGLRLRPELAEARLRIERNRLDVVQTRNGLLPRLDLFVTLGKSGYADSFGRSVSHMDGSYYEAEAGIRFNWSLGNRSARAQSRRAEATRAQAEASLDNLAQLIVKDIRDAYLEVERSRAQIEASAVRRRLQEEVLRAEQVKFDVGRGTALTVAQAQRDLLESRLDEVNAVIGYRRARIDLYRLDGSLLRRRGIDCGVDASLDKLYPTPSSRPNP